ncbi:MAG: hypothetical protein LPK25_03195 [Cyclobacteriaceae bacterium]|nr:hypothetical protein [Cyclobacteriaceae bacterium]
MTDFLLPVDGSVVVVDDKIEDAMPLIELLSRLGISCTYFSGDDDDKLPSPSLRKVRMAFFDIQLFGPSDATSYAVNVARLIDRLVPESNGPYVLILWTTIASYEADTVESQILHSAQLKNKKPLKIIRLEKTRYFQNVQSRELLDSIISEVDTTLSARFDPDDIDAIKEVINESVPLENKKVVITNALDEISEELSAALQGAADSFQFFTHWEEAINSAAGSTVNHVSSLYNVDEHWPENLKNIIFRMAKAQLEQNINLEVSDEILKNALKTINGTFLDQIESHYPNVAGIAQKIGLDKDNIPFIQTIDGIQYKSKLVQNYSQLEINVDDRCVGKLKLDDKPSKLGSGEPEKRAIQKLKDTYQGITPSVNTMLLLDFSPPNNVQPGNVYIKKIHRNKRKEEILRNYLAQNSTIFDQNGLLIICHKELKRFLFIELEITPLCDYAQNKWIKYRLLPGILMPVEYYNNINGDNFYKQIPIIKYKGVKYRMVFDFRLLKSIDKDKHTSDQAIFRVRNELFSSILSSLSSHASRIGITSLE